ncbi:MAG TPA: TetR family transcriptional regulator [Pseudolysinimonas sp.]|nr:TetR family transcriptional regulator [Pseudolysinimonas sp.]
MTTVSDDRSAESGLEPGLRERKKQQTRHAIHEAALRLIDEQGLEATTIDQICSEADVSSRTFFNYFPSKAAALLQLPQTPVTPEARERFLAARGGLVWALCEVVGSSSDIGPDRPRLKQLIGRHPELITTVSTMMQDLRAQFVALATERASSPEHAELAVAVVMTAFGATMHDEAPRDESLVTRLRKAVEQLRDVLDEQLV